jgi:hypothetical protein
MFERLIAQQETLLRNEARQPVRDDHKEVLMFLHEQLNYWNHIVKAGGPQ